MNRYQLNGYLNVPLFHRPLNYMSNINFYRCMSIKIITYNITTYKIVN